MSTHDFSNPHDIPPHLRALDELLIGEAQDVSNAILDAQGATLLRIFDNHIERRFKQWEQDMQKRIAAQQRKRDA